MKRILLLFGFFVITTTGLYAQVGIGTRDPHATAQLEVKADKKGVLIPRVQLEAIKNPSPIATSVSDMQNSLLVYNTETSATSVAEENKVYPGYYFWYNGAWNRVVSQNDFSNTNITKNILKGSNIVTYNSKSNTLNYYTKDGTQTSVNIVDVINNTDSSTTINIDKITPANGENLVLSTVTKVVTLPGGATTITKVVEWKSVDEVSKSAHPIKGGDGIQLVDGSNVEQKAINAALAPFTIKVKDLDISALRVKTSTTVQEGDILVINKDGSVTTTNIASKISTGTLKSDGSVTVSNGAGAVLKDVTIEVGKVNVDKLEVSDAAEDKQILIVDKSSGNKSITYTSTTDLINNNITKGNLTGGDGVSVTDGGKKLLDGNATIEISNLPVSKLEGGLGNAGKILTVEKGTGSVTWTSNLPEGTTVSITNIKTATPTTSGTDTSTVVVTIDPNTGVATTTTIQKLLSNTVKVGNGLSKDSDGKIVLGGKLEKATTISTTKTNTLAITGLTNTGTTADDKVMVLGKDNVLHTVSITSLKGSGDYTVTNTYSVDTDKETGNTFNDGTKSYPEKIRTVEIPLNKDSANYLSSENLKLEGYDSDKILVTEVKIFSKGKIKTTGTEKRSVTFSAANYTIEGNLGIVEPGISSGGLSAPIYRGTYYVTIKYIDKTK